MPAYAGAATKPYAVVQAWRLQAFSGLRYTLSVHAKLSLATSKARANRDACCWLWGAYPPWFVWEVIDRRTGDLLHTYP